MSQSQPELMKKSSGLLGLLGRAIGLVGQVLTLYYKFHK